MAKRTLPAQRSMNPKKPITHSQDLSRYANKNSTIPFDWSKLTK